MAASNRETDLEILGNFILDVGRKCIRWNPNVEADFVKDIMLDLIRCQVPYYIKDAILKSDINPEQHHTFDDIRDKIISIQFPDRKRMTQMRFVNVYDRYLTQLPEKSEYRKNGQSLSSKEEAERFAKNAARVCVGNCNECRDVCESIWAECTADILKWFRLPSFSSNDLPYLEQVRYRDSAVHCFGIVNRPQSSDFNNLESWIADGQVVLIVDLWGNPNEVISINKQILLPENEQNPIFLNLRMRLAEGIELESVSERRLGEGHSLHWKGKGRSETHFIEKKYPSAGLYANNRNRRNTANQRDDNERDEGGSWLRVHRDRPY